MNPVSTQQVALDNALVAPEKRLKIEKCYGRIAFNKLQREATYQVTLDALKLSPCYPAFLITTEICLIIPDQEFGKPPLEEELVSFIQELGYSGKCASLGRQQDMIGTGNHEIKSCGKYGALIHDGMINLDIKDSKDYKTYYDFATGKATPKKSRKFKKVASPTKKLPPVLEEELVKKPKKAKKHSKKSTIVPTTGVLIRDTPGVSVSKKKAPAKVDRGKYIDIHSDAVLLKAAQVKEALKKSKKDSYMLHASGSDDGVGSQPKGDSEDDDSKDDDSDDDDSDDVSKHDDDDDADSNGDGENDASDSERTDSDEDENPNLNLKDDEEEERQDGEYVHTPNYYVPTDEETNDERKEFDEEEYDQLYKDVNVRSKVIEHEEVGKRDDKKTDAAWEYVSQENSYEQVVDDAHVTLTATYKIDGLIQSSSISSDFTIPVTAISKTSTVAATTVPPIIHTVNKSLGNVILAKSSSQLKSSYEAATSLIHRELYDALVKSYQLDKDLFESYGKTYSLERGRDDKDKDEDPPTRSEQGLKKRKTSKDVEPPKGSKSKESKSSSSNSTKSQPKSSVKSVQEEEPVFGTADTEMPQDQGSNLGNIKDKPKPQTWISIITQAKKPPLTFDELMSTPIDFSAYVMHNLKIDNLTQEHLVGPAFNLLKGTCKSRVELEYHFKECYKAVNGLLDWNNPEGQEYPFDLSKPLPLIKV
ncbi:hypothetical protein Tco_0993383 [Tanacetum coccineum]|uniref:Uncharacterized protein n=1 Tax=Tanacetum coccineum TaxID=301880 RepID=A0ABQ5F5K7_9ASTR